MIKNKLIRMVICAALAVMLGFGAPYPALAYDGDSQGPSGISTNNDEILPDSEISSKGDAESNQETLGGSMGAIDQSKEDTTEPSLEVEKAPQYDGEFLEGDLPASEKGISRTELKEAEPPLISEAGGRIIPDGVYGFSLHMKSRFVLGVSSSLKGSKLQVQRASGNATQLFSIIWQESEKAYRITSISTDLTVAVSGFNAPNGSSLLLWNDNGTKNMRWTINAQAGGGFTIESLDTGKFVDFAANQPLSGVDSVAWEPTGSVKQVFDLVDADQLVALNKDILGPKTIENGIYSISCSTAPNQAIGVRGGATQNGVELILQKKQISVDQKFYVTFQEVDENLGYYTVRALCSGKVLAVSGSGAINGTPVVQWEDNGTANMRWVIEQKPSGGFSFVSSDTGLNLDCACSTPVAGASIVVWENTTSQKQHFIFTREKTLESGYYTISPKSNDGLAVAINKSSSVSEMNTILARKEDAGFSGKYEFIETEEGAYRIRSLLSGMFLCVSKEGKIVQAVDRGQLSQYWNIMPDAYGGFSLSTTNDDTTRVSFWTGSDISLGASLWAQDASAVNSNQSFNVQQTSLVVDDVYTARVAVDMGYALSMSRLTLDSGNDFCLAYARDAAMQQFQVINKGNNVIQLASPLTNKVLCVGYGSSRGASAVQWENNNTDNMKWRVIPTYQGSVYLQNVANGMNLDYASNFLAPMAKLVVWDSHGGDKQKFTFNKTTYNPPRNEAVETGLGTYYWFDKNGRVNSNEAISTVINTARSLLGVPYVWLGVYPQDGGMDCASFTWYLYRQLGIDVGFETYDQMHAGVRVHSMADARPGDLILMYYDGWPNYNPFLPEHVVLYAGNGMIYEEPTFGGHCQYVPLSSKGATKIDIRRIIH